MSHHWNSHQLAVLRRLREGFLSGPAGQADYWKSEEILSLYDRTYAERIGWKWDAMLRQLKQRQWLPQCTHLLDWGCGSGVANRRILNAFPQLRSLSLHDRSPLAMRFASAAARQLKPTVPVRLSQEINRDTLVILSHVINELAAPDLTRLLERLRTAGAVIWLEAGTHSESRRLSEVRAQFLNQSTPWEAVAPCPHQSACGMLTTENDRHWCHHFAQPPSEIFQDSAWAEFSRELGIDLRSLPYSYLVLQRKQPQPATPPGLSRIIGQSRPFKGHDKVLCCEQSGLVEWILQKRDAPEILKSLNKYPEQPLYRWQTAEGKILGGEAMDSPLGG